MPRTKLTDEYWLKLKPILLDAGIYDKPNLRMTFEGMLFRIRVGGQWPDLPKEFGNWNSIFKRFNEWSKSGKLMLVFKILSKGPDLEWEPTQKAELLDSIADWIGKGAPSLEVAILNSPKLSGYALEVIERDLQSPRYKCYCYV